MMVWHIFNMDSDGPFASFRTYREAILEAQCRLDTTRRPKRFIKGFYELHGENTQYDIATTQVAAQQGFDWAVRMLNDED